MKIFKETFSILEHLFVFAVLTAFSLLRLPSLFEPAWYGDEGIYQVIGKAINMGRLLYRDIWDNKPPLLYLTYALVHSDQFLVRLLSLLFGLGSVVGFYFLAKRVLQSMRLAMLTTGIFAFLLAIPPLEGNIANAENFMLTFVIFAALLVFYSSEYLTSQIKTKPLSIPLFSAGVLLGVAFLYKIVAFFDFTAFLLFLIFTSHVIQGRKLHKSFIYFLIGFTIPLVITLIYFSAHNALSDFFQATFSQNITYIGYKNYLFIPQGLLIVKLVLLSIVVFIILRKKKTLEASVVFTLLWLAFSLFSIFFSQRPYTHYVLVGLPSLSLLIGLILKKKQFRTWYIGMLLASLFLILRVFDSLSFVKLPGYYLNFSRFALNHMSYTAYQQTFDPDVPRNYDIARYIRSKNPGETILVWGNTAQIYVLSNTMPPGKYTVAYHVNTDEAKKELSEAMQQSPPRFIVILPDAPPLPFGIIPYVYKATIHDASIYERTTF